MLLGSLSPIYLAPSPFSKPHKVQYSRVVHSLLFFDYLAKMRIQVTLKKRSPPRCYSIIIRLIISLSSHTYTHTHTHIQSTNTGAIREIRHWLGHYNFLYIQCIYSRSRYIFNIVEFRAIFLRLQM